MSHESIGSSASPDEHPAWPALRAAFRAMRRDFVLIAGAAILAGLAGAALGYRTMSASASAQLLVTGFPMRTNFDHTRDLVNYDPEDSALPRTMLATGNAKTVGILISSDEVYARVLERLREEMPEAAGAPPVAGSIDEVRAALSYTIQAALDTPYHKYYSPIVILTAHHPEPSYAQKLVNAWADASVEASRGMWRQQHEPAAQAIRLELDTLTARLEDAQTAFEQFQESVSTEALQQRVYDLIDALSEAQQAHDAMLRQLVGVDNPEENRAYQRMLNQLEETNAELREAQAKLAQAELREGRLQRAYDVLADVHEDLAAKHEYMRLTSNLNFAGVQVLSYGAQWGMPGWQRPAFFSAAGFVWGAVLAAALSVFLRVALREPGAA